MVVRDGDVAPRRVDRMVLIFAADDAGLAWRSARSSARGPERGSAVEQALLAMALGPGGRPSRSTL